MEAAYTLLDPMAPMTQTGNLALVGCGSQTLLRTYLRFCRMDRGSSFMHCGWKDKGLERPRAGSLARVASGWQPSLREAWQLDGPGTWLVWLFGVPPTPKQKLTKGKAGLAGSAVVGASPAHVGG